jgi:hypothetical protein
MTEIVLKTRDEVAGFLSTIPDPDEDIPWCCPHSDCLVTNKNNVYHSRQARCSSCGQGHFPAVRLPIIGDARGTLKKIFIEERIGDIKKEIKEQEKEIENHEDEIRECQCYINELKKEEGDLNKTLTMLVQEWRNDE